MAATLLTTNYNMGNFNINRKIFTIICLACVISYFLRTVFIPFKYTFLALTIPSILFVAIKYKEWAYLNFKTLICPLLAIVFYAIHIKNNGYVLSEVSNALICLLFSILLSRNISNKNTIKVLKYVAYTICFIGFISIIKFVISQYVATVPFERYWTEESPSAVSLVRDYNFFALHFVLATIISLYLLTCREISKTTFSVVVLISFVQIVLSFSRRSLLAIVIVIGLCIVICFWVNKKTSLFESVSYYLRFMAYMIGTVILLFIVFHNDIYSKIATSSKYSTIVYRAYSIFNNDVSYFDVNWYFWNKSKELNKDNEGNLFYNGDLSQKMEFWKPRFHPEDTIIATYHKEDGRFIRIEKKNSIFGWSLTYSGRPIFYHAGIEYTYSFKYRVIKGDSLPFRVGLWVEEDDKYIDNLSKETSEVGDGWKLCSASHVFKQDQRNPTSFLNCQHPNTIIDIKDIKLTCNDTLGLPMYVDQVPISIIKEHYTEEDTANNMISPRTERWKYAWEIWQTRYTMGQKIFGQGFDYLTWYGERFHNNPKRYDFPHNPIISAFLYSGIVGGIVYIGFLVLSILFYWKKRQQLRLFFVMYLCCMFFCMFSGNSHFSFPLFAFLSFLPFVEFNDCEVDG